jgi:hypothetical protein
MSQYRAMRDSGASAGDVYRKAASDGVGAVELYRLLRDLFGLSLTDAKRAIAQARGDTELLDDVRQALDELDDGVAK